MWTLFYIIYTLTTIRFLLHNGILAFPIPKQRFKSKKSNRKILIQYPICNESIEFVERFLKSLETIPKKERSRFLLQICDDSKVSILSYLKKRKQMSLKWMYLRRWDDKTNTQFRLKNKASNLNYGLSKAPKKYGYVCIYDADHVMEGTGLLKAANILEANPKVVIVQSQWNELKRLNTWLSILQEQILFVHIQREQTFKSKYNLWPIFNGAGAIVKRDIIMKEFGGFITQNVCEDTDISGLLNARGYQIKVLPTWKTYLDHVYSWKEYKKQQIRWAQGTGYTFQRHIRDNNGWGLKKLYWLSWNLGHLVALTKYLIFYVIIYKWLNNISFTYLEYIGCFVHIPAWIASGLTWNNKLHLRGFITYPLHFIVEHAILPYQIYGFWFGIINWKKHIDFVVTGK